MSWSSTRVMFADLVAMYRAQEGQWSAQRWEVRAPLWTLVECGPDYLSPEDDAGDARLKDSEIGWYPVTEEMIEGGVS